MKKIAYMILIILTLVLLAGCKKDKNNDKAITEYEPKITLPPKNNQVEITPIPEETHEGEVRSTLTGLWVAEEIGRKRPYAIQFSNFKTVRNQWGISQGDIVYEAIVEGGITRLLAIGENFSGERIGSVRSSRHYFASIADEYDAIYIHYGKTKYAKSKLSALGIDNLDGETGIGTTVFYRDNNMSAPHNAFASLDGILKGIEKKGYETEHSSDFEAHYSFYEEDTDLTSTTIANKVTVDFSYYTSPYFTYNTEDKLYYRFQFNEEHKDSNTDKQLTFKNIIIQFVKQRPIDKNDYQTIDFEDATGSGYYITNGKKVDITWKKNENNKWMRYYDESGNELTINPGKTYIAMFPNNRVEDIVIDN
ncbi:MAG TPA: DUF3048 domain-containing protein [Clostridiales bacterium]|nr:DUF3048 domain-containing protein [Clostridiales bacterium]